MKTVFLKIPGWCWKKKKKLFFYYPVAGRLHEHCCDVTVTDITLVTSLLRGCEIL